MVGFRIFILLVVCVIVLACFGDSSDNQTTGKSSAEPTQSQTTHPKRTASATQTSEAIATSRQSAPKTEILATKPVLSASKEGESRGYLTTPQELTVIADKADQGIEPYQSG